MQFATITAIAFGLFAAQTMACGTVGNQCNSPGAHACQCNAGDIVACEESPSGSGYIWRFYGNCPAVPPGQLECVNGKCTGS